MFVSNGGFFITFHFCTRIHYTCKGFAFDLLDFFPNLYFTPHIDFYNGFVNSLISIQGGVVSLSYKLVDILDTVQHFSKAGFMFYKMVLPFGNSKCESFFACSTKIHLGHIDCVVYIQKLV